MMTVVSKRTSVDADRARIYGTHVLAQAPRLLAQLDRESHSRTHGSFDREHWSWKFRDFPLGMLQVAAYPLALLWRYPLPGSPYTGNTRLLEWIGGALAATLRRQHADGTFDAFSPNERQVGPTLGVAHGLAATFRIVRGSLGPEREAAVLDAITRACDFGLERDEEHAFVSNHYALFAVSLLDAHELTGRPEYRRRAGALVERIIAEQSPDGWYNEYGGPDPGYESLGIHHLAVFLTRNRLPGLLDSLRRSIECFACFVHPDGSIGGQYGSRNTSLYFPGGFELLAGEIPAAAAVARFMRDRLDRGNVVTPGNVDIENLPALAYSYVEAALAPDAKPAGPVPPLPCESLQGVRLLPHATAIVAGAPQYYAIANAAKGGACRIFSRSTGRIAYEDAGYVVSAGARRWAAQLAVPGTPAIQRDGNQFACEVVLGEARQELLTPARLVLLRLLNLTAFRSRLLGSWIRRRIVGRLITSRRAGPVRLHRSIVFEPDAVRFLDRLEARGVAVDGVDLPRSYTALHMGSAKYFHAAELEPVPAAPVSGMAEELAAQGRAVRAFRIRFGTDVRPELVSETAES